SAGARTLPSHAGSSEERATPLLRLDNAVRQSGFNARWASFIAPSTRPRASWKELLRTLDEGHLRAVNAGNFAFGFALSGGDEGPARRRRVWRHTDEGWRNVALHVRARRDAPERCQFILGKQRNPKSLATARPLQTVLHQGGSAMFQQTKRVQSTRREAKFYV